LPETCARTWCLFSSSTRNIAFGRGSITVAITSMASSFEFPESFFFLSSSGLAISSRNLLRVTNRTGKNTGLKTGRYKCNPRWPPEAGRYKILPPTRSSRYKLQTTRMGRLLLWGASESTGRWKLPRWCARNAPKDCHRRFPQPIHHACELHGHLRSPWARLR